MEWIEHSECHGAENAYVLQTPFISIWVAAFQSWCVTVPAYSTRQNGRFSRDETRVHAFSYHITQRWYSKLW